MLSGSPSRLAHALLTALEDHVVPPTREAVLVGNKVFGGAILLKVDGSLVVAGTNRETESPLWHGEMSTIDALYRLPANKRPPPKDCLFLSTHEPCSMCLSAITWAGYDRIYYLFPYEDTRDTFQIPHDLRILEEVFRCPDGSYSKENAFWKSESVHTIIARCPEGERRALEERAEDLAAVYGELSEMYQQNRDGSDIPLP